MDATERLASSWRWLILAFALGACSDAARLLDASTELATFDPPTSIDAAVLDAGDDASIVREATVDAPPDDAISPAGMSFRVWAPAATAATLVGPFGERAMTRMGESFSVTVPEAAAGQRVHFALQHGDRRLVRVDPRARQIDGGEGVLVDPAAYVWRTPTFRPPALRQTVVYELHVGSFSVPEGARNGTFASAAARLDQLRDLGVNAIELMPVTEFGSGVTWGYSPRHWFATNAAYGTPDDLRRFVDEAHARGIAVMLDVVFNHYSGSTAAPLYCFDGDCPTGTYGPYFFRDTPFRSTPWGPRPDFARGAVADAIVDSVAMWLSEYHLDGFRWDSVSNIRGIDGMGVVPGGRELIVRANALTQRLRPGAIVVAEDLKGYDAITRDAASGGFDFDAQWDGFVYDVGRVLTVASDDARDMDVVRNAILGQYNGDPFQRVIGTENHDTVGNGGARIPQRVDSGDPTGFAARKRSMLGAALMLTAPGVPMLFMGQEHLELGTFASTPAALDWTREESQSQVRAFWRQMVRLRRNLDGQSAGLLGAHVEILHFHAANKVIAFRRWDRGGDNVVVVMNLRNRGYARYDLGLPAGGDWRVRLDSDDPRWGADFHGTPSATVRALAQRYDSQPFTGSVALGPWSVVVLSQGAP